MDIVTAFVQDPPSMRAYVKVTTDCLGYLMVHHPDGFTSTILITMVLLFIEIFYFAGRHILAIPIYCLTTIFGPNYGSRIEFLAFHCYILPKAFVDITIKALSHKSIFSQAVKYVFGRWKADWVKVVALVLLFTAHIAMTVGGIGWVTRRGMRTRSLALTFGIMCYAMVLVTIE